MLNLVRESLSLRPSFLRLPRSYIPTIALTAGLILTCLTAYFASKNATLTLSARFDRLTEEIRTTIESRILVYQNAILQARGLVQLYPDLDRHSFKTYADNMNFPIEYPGVMGLGFIQAVPPSQLPGVEKKIRQEYENQKLKIWPLVSGDPTEPAYIIRFFEPEMAPVGGHSLLGFNIQSDPARKAAHDHARDTGEIVLSHPLHLIQDPGTEQIGYVLLVPAYRAGRLLESVEQRREAHLGFVYTAFRARDLFDGIFPKDFVTSFRVSFDVHDPLLGSERPSKSTEIFGYGNSGGPDTYDLLNPSHSRLFHVRIGDRRFAVRAYALDGFIPYSMQVMPWLILIAGSMLSWALYLILSKNQRQAEVISKSERQIRLVTDALPALVSYVDDNLRYRFVNRKYEEWFRSPRARFIGATVKDMVPERSFTKLKPLADRVLAGESIRAEYTLDLPDGSSLPVRSSFIPDFGPGGTVKGFVALVSDDSERKRQEEHHRFLAELGAVLSASLDIETTLNRFALLLVPSLGDWCVIDMVDDEGHIRRMAGACADPAKSPLMEILKSKFTPDLDSSNGTAHVIRTGEPLLYSAVSPESLHSHSIDQDRLRILLGLGLRSSMILPLKARNRVIGSVCIASSHPEKTFTERDLEFAMDIVRRAALAIDNATLYRESQRASRAKDEFLATLSHELRTPMNVIMGWLEILQTEHLDQETHQQALSTLNRNAQAQLQLINDLLDISRIISGKISLNVGRADLKSIVRSAIDGVRPAARNKNITLIAEIPEEECLLQGDSDRIQQVLWNLLSNAVKFTPEDGRIRVSIACSPTSLQLTVEDTGQGIEPHFLPYVFDRFRQEDGSTTRTQGGLGLGLSIVRYLVELHGGRAEARSEGRGKGALFMLTFPRGPLATQQDSFADTRTPTTAEVVIPSNAQLPLAGLRVLLVDDSPDVTVLLSRILSRAGALVRTASSAQEGFQKLQSERPDVLLSDIGLPEEDGFSFMRRWREHESRQKSEHVPAGALTAYAQESDSCQAMEAGFDCHIPKPVTAAELVTAVAHLAGREAPAGAEPEPDAKAESAPESKAAEPN